MQEKYGQSTISTNSNSRPAATADQIQESESSSESEDEDDEGVLASEALDAQIRETLEAIRKKDPRVYDKNINFYSSIDEGVRNSADTKLKDSKPMYLRDYHRKNLLESGVDREPQDVAVSTFAEQQGDLKKTMIKEMHADRGASGSDSEEDGFLIAKHTTSRDPDGKTYTKSKMQELDVENADKDPEAYLSNFMSARAWVPTGESRFQPFESDDDDEDRRAEEFEEAYNLRFEDPATANEKLMSHARDAAAKYSVRKEALNPRKRAREADRAKNEAAKQVRAEEKARLRKLKVAEAEKKMQKIKEAAGLSEKSLDEQDWSTFLEEEWDHARWEEEMITRFGDKYYANNDADSAEEGETKRKKLKKPKWDDDIEIDDLIPGFKAEDNERPQIELSDDSDTCRGTLSDNTNTRPKKTDRQKHLDQQKKRSHQERRKVERLVDEQMNIDETLSKSRGKHASKFRYRETSPLAFGLTSHDILMASDSQLNQYAGLKKMAAFRASDKKRKDKKQLGKKARLRQWRKDTFGDEHGPKQTLSEVLAGDNNCQPLSVISERRPAIDTREGTIHKRRRKAAIETTL